METLLSILFYAKTSKKHKSGETPIYLRVTINRRRFEVTTGRQILPVKRCKVSGKVNGNSEESKTVNYYLDTLYNRVINLHREIISEERELTVENFRDKWIGIKEKPRMILEIFREHNRQMKMLVGKDYAAVTYVRFETSLKHTESFLKWKYGVKDLEIKKLDYYFISEYAFWLKSIRNCNHNSTLKYLSNFKKIVNLCLKNSWLVKNFFTGFKMVKKEVVREILTLSELENISTKEFSTAQTGIMRDVFLFCCYTGLGYADVKKLKRHEIVTGIDAEKWIFTSRQKTHSSSRIPLLGQALKIIEKYSSNPVNGKSDLLLPVLSNQKMNAHLKIIADKCQINKRFAFHIARHTFATTITLSNGIPMESVSKMLGHSSIKTTQIYAKVLDLKVSQDMNKIKHLFR